MVAGLFIVFDPASVWGLHLNWVSMVVGFILFPFVLWVMPCRFFGIWGLVFKGLAKEVGFLYFNWWGGVSLMLCSLFCFIVMNNFLGLFPFIFTATSHILVTLSLALPLWVALMLFGWVNSASFMFAHLVPVGTPMGLMGFMVLIETVSNLIRPITLSIRLAANMIAGHLLIVLLGSAVSFSAGLLFGGLFMLGLLFLLELAVAFIQSYVFMVLLGLYSAEI